MADVYMRGEITLRPELARDSEAYSRALAQALNAAFDHDPPITAEQAQDALDEFVFTQNHAIDDDGEGHLILSCEGDASGSFVDLIASILAALGNGDLQVEYDGIGSGIRLQDGEQTSLEQTTFLAVPEERASAWTEIAQAASIGAVSQETATLLQRWLSIEPSSAEKS